MWLEQRGKGSYYPGQPLPLDDVKRKGRQTVLWGGLNAGLEREGSLRSFLKSSPRLPMLRSTGLCWKWAALPFVFHKLQKHGQGEKATCDTCQRTSVGGMVGQFLLYK